MRCQYVATLILAAMLKSIILSKWPTPHWFNDQPVCCTYHIDSISLTKEKGLMAFSQISWHQWKIALPVSYLFLPNILAVKHFVLFLYTFSETIWTAGITRITLDLFSKIQPSVYLVNYSISFKLHLFFDQAKRASNLTHNVEFILIPHQNK